MTIETIEIKTPLLPESVSDATIAAWRKQPGERVQAGEPLLDLETDKVVLEVPAPQEGALAEIVRKVGDTVTAGELLGRLRVGDAAAPTATERPATETPKRAAESAPADPATPPSAPPPPAPPAPSTPPPLGPAARRLVAEHNLDAGAIPGSGRGGRITKEDVVQWLAKRDQQTDAAKPATAPPPAPPPPAPPPPASATAATAPTPLRAAEKQASTEDGERSERRVPMSRLRARIAERLLETTRNTAMLTTFNEVDLSAVKALRARYRETFEKRHAARLGFMSLFVRASVEALKRFPGVNASLDGDEIVYHDFYDVAVAVSTERGLVVPVLRDAQRMSLAAIERQIADFGARAQQGKLTLEEMTGGTFTITNGGVFGSMLSTPLLNPPQSAILGMHRIQERPVAVEGAVAIRPMMYLALSYDHRLIDGRDAVQFLATIRDLLQDPARMLLEV